MDTNKNWLFCAIEMFRLEIFSYYLDYRGYQKHILYRRFP